MTRNIAMCAALLILSGTALAQEPADPPADRPAAPAAAPASGPDTGPDTDPDTGADTDPDAGPGSEPTVAAAQPSAGGPRNLAGMSILGNQEAPTSLVIVPWKSSELGNGIGVSRALDPGIGPVDKEVFMRELRYYEIRTGGGN